MRFLLDENQRGLLWQLIQRHNARGLDPIDALRIGDSLDLPLGLKDPEILQWCEREDCILVSSDRKSMPGHLRDHLAHGHHSPGVFIMRRKAKLVSVLDFLILAAYASEPNEWNDDNHFIP